jgi:hypothetical protein
MRRTITLALAGLLALAAQGRAGLPCLCTTRCMVPPCPDCPDCSCPCDHRLPLAVFGCEHTRKLICELHGETCCERIKAAKKLGCRLHADFCTDPEVLNALISALQCDPCWEVRREAAWSLLGQKARVEDAVLALYVSSKLDPHYLVRTRAAEALDILLVCRKNCFKCLFDRGDQLIAELKKRGVKPGSENCCVQFGQACHACGLVASEAPVVTPAEPVRVAPKEIPKPLPAAK